MEEVLEGMWSLIVGLFWVFSGCRSCGYEMYKRVTVMAVSWLEVPGKGKAVPVCET